MRQRGRLYILLLACWTLGCPSAQAQTHNDEGASLAVTVRGHESSVPIARFTEVLEDPTGALKFDSVRATQSGWKPVQKDALAFGYSKSVWWARVRIVNSTGKTIQAIIDLANPRQDYVHWYVLRDGGRFLEEDSTGDRLPFAQRPISTRTFALPLSLAAHEELELLIRLQSFDGVFEVMPLTVWNRSKFFSATVFEDQLLAIYHGGIAALALYNLLLFFALRERVFGLYVSYLVCFAFWSLTFRGFSFQYLWPQSPALNNDILPIAAAFTFASLGMFALAYLRIRELTPTWLWRLNQVMVAANVLAAALALAGRYAIASSVVLVTSLALSAVVMATAIWLWERGSRPARFYVIAFAVVTAGTVASILQTVSILPTNWFGTWGVEIGSAIQALLLAFGLADSMNELKAQKLAAERQAREAQEALNVQLAQQVNERTEALELANRRLHELAITDELTGAFNRRHFSAFCGAALAHRDRDEPLAFCIFDIDHFKAYNERYDMQAGNAALRAIAKAVRNELRRSGDVLFRLGGEEFGILFTAKSSDAARRFIERIRSAVRLLKISNETHSSGILTASFGVGWWDKDVADRLSPDQMYATADNMLYEAKEAGRDRVTLDAHFATGEHRTFAAQEGTS